MTNPRGSQWAKWDLQVHTPASFFHQYPGASREEQWERFLDDLASLPAEYEVIAICDYIFLDGYRRVRHAWENGRLPNLKLVLPAAEFRLNSFGGTDSQLRRVNAQVIFSDELSTDTIESQFHAALQRKYTLTNSPEGHVWQAVVTPESLADLGNALIDSAPASERHQYGPPEQEGFNNINLSLDQVLDALESHYFVGRHLLGLCKTEWDAVKWNKQSVAEKKNLINSAHLVVMSAADPAHHGRALAKLRDANVNDLLLDTSDAHYPRSSNQKDRLGNCFTWVKSEPSFKGLLHALRERDRIFVGDEPEKRRLLRAKPQLFIDYVALERVPQGEFQETWFDEIDLPLSPDLVSIIGNKGMGKSALAESIALAGGSKVERAYLSFLSEDRFCQRKNPKARNFFVELCFAGGVPSRCRLDALPDDRPAQTILFLPQNYLEQICADRGALDNFVAELDQVVYSHVREAEKLGQPTLKALIRHLMQETEQQLGRLRLELHRANERILELREKLTPENRERLQSGYQRRWEELTAARKGRPEKIERPSGDPLLDDEIAFKRAEREHMAVTLKRASDLHRTMRVRQAAVGRMEERLKNLESEVATRLESWSEDLDVLDLNSDEIVTFSVRDQPLIDRRDDLRGKIGALDRWTDADEAMSLVAQGVSLDHKLKSLRDRLAEPSRRYQAYLEEVETWRARVRELVGDASTPESLRFLRLELEALEAVVPAELKSLLQERRLLSFQILEHIDKLRERYRSLHKPVSDFVAKHPALREKLGLEFAVGTETDALEEAFFSLVHHGRSGAFYGREAAAQKLRQLMGAYDFESPGSAMNFADALIALLDPEFAEHQTGAPLTLHEQLMDGRKPIEALDLIYGFGYVKTHYVLKMRGRDLKSLSPGERGLLLLVFYLMVSRDSRPLVIDQPEGNLDNESIVDVLVPCIREAKKTRQIILVTHNPNLAVVCDSEQVVRASIDPTDGFRVSYRAGAIEDPAINRWLVDVLEGTWPAFTTRRDRYFRPSG